MNQSVPSHVETLIVGGGATGAGLFRDLALHKNSVLLIDKKDFGSQTSNASSRMLHGGIRYLENYDFALVREALFEKNLWIKMAPHLASEHPFCMPIYSQSKYNMIMLRMGVLLYDALSFFKNSPHKILSKKETLKHLPGLNEKGLKGSGIYYDAIVDDVKITLESIYDGAKEKNAHALNYTEITELGHSEKGYTATIKDILSGESKKITATHIIFAIGPFTDELLLQFPILNWKRRLLPSQGAHLCLRRDALAIKGPLVIQTKDGRIVFVVPHPDYILVGTTEVKPMADFFDIKPQQIEIEYLLQGLNDYFPESHLTEKDVLSSYAGIRPLVRAGESENHHKTTRDHKTFYPKENIFVIVGGKLTTFRVMGRKITKSILAHSKTKYKADKTLEPLRHHSLFGVHESHDALTKERLLQIKNEEFVRTKEDLLKRRLGLPSKAHYRGNGSYEELMEKVDSIF